MMVDKLVWFLVLVFYMVHFCCVLCILKSVYYHRMKLSYKMLTAQLLILGVVYTIFGEGIGQVFAQLILPCFSILYGERNRKPIIILYAISAVYLIGIIVTSIGFGFQSLYLNNIFNNEILQYIILILIQCLLVIFLFFTIRKINMIIKISAIESIIIIFFGYVLNYIFKAWNNIDLDMVQVMKIDTTTFAITQGLMMCVGFLFCLFIWVNKRFGYIVMQNSQNEACIQMQYEYFKEYKNNHMEVRRFRHDIQSHFLCINRLIQQEKYSTVGEYVEELQTEYNKMSIFVSTGDDTVDTIVNAKINNIKEENITLYVDGKYEGKDAVSMKDMCVIFSNALDNAIEANEKLKLDAVRYIKLTFFNTEYYSFITITNPFVPITKSDFYQTQKPDKENHGLGLNNIRSTVKRNFGKVEIYTTDKEFIIEIMLPKQQSTTVN